MKGSGFSTKMEVNRRMSKKGKKKSKKISSVDGNRPLADNRQARYEYEILETLETG